MHYISDESPVSEKFFVVPYKIGKKNIKIEQKRCACQHVSEKNTEFSQS